MKKLLLSAFVAFAMLASTRTFAQQGFGTNTPSKSAAVDIVSSQRGLLIPRLNLVATNDAAPIASTPAQSLLVYNNATAGSGTTAVTPGFYYWDTNKWVRIVSTATEKNTTVVAGNNVLVDSELLADGVTTQYTVSVEGGNNGQVLVTVPNPSYNSSDPTSEQFISEWVNVSDFINGVNGITVTPVTNPTTGVIRNEISIGGALTDTTGTEIITNHAAGKTLAIQGLEVLTTFNPADDKIVIMDANGVLKSISPANLLSAKDLTLGDGLNFETGITGNDGVGAVLKATKIEIKDQSVTAEKLAAATDGSDVNKIPVANANGSVEYKDASTAIGKTLTTDNIIGVGVNAASATASSLDGAVLTPTYLKIKDDAITAAQIAPNAVTNSELAASAVTADKMQSKNTAAGTNAGLGTVPVADGVGGVTYQTVASAVGENLTTDGKIVIGSTNATTLADAVLVPTELKIAANSITSADIKDGTIQATDIKAPGTTSDSSTGGTTNQVLVTDGSGNVSWQPQSGIAMGGDVTGTTGANEISKLQGVTVDAKGTNAPANGEVLTYDGATETWTPKTVAEASGKGLTTDSVIEITGTGATTISSATQSVLKDITLSIGADKITGAHIATDAVGALELADNSVASANIINGSIANVDLGDRSVSANKMTATVTDATGTVVTTAPVNTVATAGAGGIVEYKAITPDFLTDKKTLTTDGVIVIGADNTATGVTAANSLLADVKLNIGADKITATHIAADAVGASELANNAVASENIIDGSVGNVDLAAGSVSADKMTSYTTANGTATPVTGGMVPTADGSGGVTYQTVAAAAGKTLTGAGITVTAGTAAGTGTSLAQSVLADVTLGIANDAITTDKIAAGAVSNSDIANGAVSANKMTATVTDATGAIVSTATPGTVATAGAAGTVEYKTIAEVAGENLTTDGKIVIGNNTSNVTSLVDAVLTPTQLSIKQGSIGNVELTNGSVTADKMISKDTAAGGNVSAGMVPTADGLGGVAYTTVNNSVNVINGLYKDATAANVIKLGGALTENTKITTNGSTLNTFNLAIENLVAPTTAATEVMYSEGATGVLRKAVRSISQYIEASQIINTISGYNDFVQEVNITAKIVSGDINVTLPAATATNKGQVVNVKITNTTEVADYLNILVGSTTLTYGALPYQSWIIKSNGTTWEVVGRN